MKNYYIQFFSEYLRFELQIFEHNRITQTDIEHAAKSKVNKKSHKYY